MKGWKEETFDIKGTKLKVAVASGLANAKALMEAVRRGDVQYDFVEIMACPGGCVGGGGQPFKDGFELAGEQGRTVVSAGQRKQHTFLSRKFRRSAYL